MGTDSFKRKYLPDEKNPNEGRDIFTVSLSPEQRVWLNEAKKQLQVEGDGTALKALAELGVTVLQSSAGSWFVRHLASRLDSLRWKIRKKRVKV